jgi:alpha-glucosidase
MVWEAEAKNGGFSEAKPWLPVPPEHLARAVDAQQGDEASLLEHYRRFLAFRRFHPALAKGDIAFLPSGGDTVAFTRGEGNERLVCVFNLSSRAAEVDLDAGLTAQPLSGHGFAGEVESGRVKLDGYGAWFGRLA